MSTSRRVDSALARAISRRRFVQGLAVGAGGLAGGLLLGCQSSGTSATAGPASGAGPVRGGTLNVAVLVDISPTAGNLSLAHSRSGTNFQMLGAVYDRLIRYSSDSFKANPELAESFSFSSDYRSLTFKLRPGVKFHNGRPVTAEDVKWNIERVTDPTASPQFSSFAKWVQRMETPDASTLVLSFDQARPSILDLFEFLSIADPQTYQQSLDGKNFVGTGPFMFKEWVPGDHYTMVRNPDYWQKDLPYLDEVSAKLIPDPSSQLINLQTGAIDVAAAVDARDAKSLENDKNYFISTYVIRSHVLYMGVDVKAPIFSDKRARQALAYLIDRKRIIDSVLIYGEEAPILWGKDSPAYDDELAKRYSFNLDKAKELLAQVQKPDVTIPINTNSAQPYQVGVAEIVQAELAKVGIKSSVEKLQPAEYTKKWTAGEFRGLWTSNVGYLYLSPSTPFILAFPLRIPNSSNYESPEYKAAIDGLLKAGTEAEIKKAARPLNEILVDEAFVIPISKTMNPVAVSAKVKGWELTRANGWKIEKFWKSK